jgi:hypothetical protein
MTKGFYIAETDSFSWKGAQWPMGIAIFGINIIFALYEDLSNPTRYNVGE